jgi:hypothetical protein
MKLLPIVRMVGGNQRRPETLKFETVAQAKVDDEFYDRLSQFRWVLGSECHRVIEAAKPKLTVVDVTVDALGNPIGLPATAADSTTLLAELPAEAAGAYGLDDAGRGEQWDLELRIRAMS